MSAVSDPSKPATVKKGPRQWGGMTPKEASLKGAAVRRVREAEKRAEKAERQTELLLEKESSAKLRMQLANIVLGQMPDRDEVSKFAGGAALKILGMILTGDVAINEKTAVPLLKTCYEVMRLGDELPTAIRAESPLTEAERKSHAKDLLARVHEARRLKLVEPS